jgi:hypothetical protein
MPAPRFLVLLLAAALPAAVAPALVAADGPAPAPLPPAATKPATEIDALGQLAEEERWTFEPQINRIDPFYDLEAILALPNPEIVNGGPEKGPGLVPGAEVEALRAWGKQELVRVEGFILGRKWDDALKATEADLKKLQTHAEDAAIVAIAEKMKRYQTQAEEAKIYEEAQAKFDALGLKVEGILWSPAGSLAVISGEPRARAINERVKDCVIINIDTNRVDFLFHYNRRRFEFQRYVGEDLNTSSKSK